MTPLKTFPPQIDFPNLTFSRMAALHSPTSFDCHGTLIRRLHENRFAFVIIGVNKVKRRAGPSTFSNYTSLPRKAISFRRILSRIFERKLGRLSSRFDASFLRSFRETIYVVYCMQFEDAYLMDFSFSLRIKDNLFYDKMSQINILTVKPMAY